MSDTQIDQEKLDAFLGKLVDIINNGMLAIMISIGHQTKLFDVLDGLPPAASQDIAAKAGLNERYVREWLGAMVTGDIVEYEPSGQTYTLPAEHAALLSRNAGANNMAMMIQFVPSVALVEKEIVECFYNGGGVPYARYGRLLEILGEGSKLRFEERLIEHVLPLSGMIDDLKKGIRVLDIGSGFGHMITNMAQAFPESHFTGYEFIEEAVISSREEARRLKLENAAFATKDLAFMDDEESYDLITANDVIHDQVYPRQVLKKVYKALKPGGTFFMVDIRASSHTHENIDHPMAPFLYSVSTLHCMTVSLAHGGEGLGAVWGEQKALDLLDEAGFKEVIVKTREGDVMNNYYVARKPHR